MIFDPQLRALPDYRQGVRDQLSVAPGIAAWGLMTGVAMVQSGLSVVEATVMTLLVYAGSAQLSALPLIAAGAPLWVVVTTAFCVNLRFVVFSLHLRPYFRHLPLAARLRTGYFTGDLPYVFFVRRHPHPAADADGLRHQHAYLAGNGLVNFLAWMLPGLVGVGLAGVLPLAWGLGFAGLMALVGVVCSLASSQLRVVAGAVAALTAVLAYGLPLRLNILTAILVAVLGSLALERWLSARAPAGADHG